MKKELLIFAIIIVALAFVSTLGVWGYRAYQTNLAKKLGTTFMQEVLAGETNKAYGLTSDTFANKNTQSQFNNTMASYKSSKAQVKIVTSNIKGKDGVLYGTLTGPRATGKGDITFKFVMGLTQKNGLNAFLNSSDWCVDSLAIQEQ